MLISLFILFIPRAHEIKEMDIKETLNKTQIQTETQNKTQNKTQIQTETQNQNKTKNQTQTKDETQIQIKNKTKTYCLLYNVENVHLLKELGLLAWGMHKYLGYNGVMLHNRLLLGHPNYPNNFHCELRYVLFLCRNIHQAQI